MDNGIVLSSRVRLARNYASIPFRARASAEQAEVVVNRAVRVLHELPETFTLYSMRDMQRREKQRLVEEHLISMDMARVDERGAALVRTDKKVSVMVNEEDHLRIQAFADGQNLKQAADMAFETEEALQKDDKFAFDAVLGYLTACPTNTGTGLRASVMLHLPLLTQEKQMGKVSQLAAKLGLTLRGIYGEGSQALGNLYQLSNQVTLGRTEDEIIEAVGAVSRQLVEMEQAAREKSMEKESVALTDQVFRGYGLLRCARRMSLKEFMVHWSNLRLGAALSLLPADIQTADALLVGAQPAHLGADDASGDAQSLDIMRATYVRHQLEAGHGDIRTI